MCIFRFNDDKNIFVLSLNPYFFGTNEQITGIFWVAGKNKMFIPGSTTFHETTTFSNLVLIVVIALRSRSKNEYSICP